MPRSGTIKSSNNMMADLYDDTGDRRWGRPVLLAFVVALFVGLLGYSYYAGTKSEDGVVIKTLYPETPYTRIKPDDTGGMTVEYQDMEIYERVDPNGIDLENTDGVTEGVYSKAETEETVEVIAEKPAPYPPFNAMPKFSKPAPVKEPVKELVQEKSVANTPENKPALDKAALENKVAAKAEPVKTSDNTASDSSAPEKAAVKIAPVETTPITVNAVTNGAYLLQLASFGNEATAQAGWKRLKAKNESLNTLNPRIQKTVIEGRGDFYRLQAGSWNSKTDADAACAALKRGGQDCLVVKR